MKTKALILALAFAFGATARADYAIAYHGKLVATGTAPISAKIPMEIAREAFHP